jgi:hypothetical protein
MSPHEQMVAKVAAVREYREGDALLHVLGLLELIELSYKERLVDVTAEELPRVQSAFKQVNLLRRSIEGEQGVVPLLP